MYVPEYRRRCWRSRGKLQPNVDPLFVCRTYSHQQTVPHEAGGCSAQMSQTRALNVHTNIIWEYTMPHIYCAYPSWPRDCGDGIAGSSAGESHLVPFGNCEVIVVTAHAGRNWNTKTVHIFTECRWRVEEGNDDDEWVRAMFGHFVP